MKFSDALSLVKTFFLEVLGFLIPGLISVTIAFIIVDEAEISSNTISLFLNPSNTFYNVLIFYTLGYVIHGVAAFFDSNFGKWKNKVHDEITNSQQFKSSIDRLKVLLKDEDISTTLNDVRSYSMSFVPEVDDKIYNFMFRYELSKNVGTTFIIFGVIGILTCLIGLASSSEKILINTSFNYFIFYLGLLLGAFFLNKTRIRFYTIAMKIIFPIFLVKYSKESNVKEY